jgi:hypothetical protein
LKAGNEPVQERHENKQAEAWQEFFDTVNASDEKIPETFERVNFSQKRIIRIASP